MAQEERKDEKIKTMLRTYTNKERAEWDWALELMGFCPDTLLTLEGVLTEYEIDQLFEIIQQEV